MASAEEWEKHFRAEQRVSEELRNACGKLRQKVELAKEILLAAKMSPALVEKILGDK